MNMKIAKFIKHFVDYAWKFGIILMFAWKADIPEWVFIVMNTLIIISCFINLEIIDKEKD